MKSTIHIQARILDVLPRDGEMTAHELRKRVNVHDTNGLMLHRALRELELTDDVELSGGMDSYPHRPWTVRRVK